MLLNNFINPPPLKVTIIQYNKMRGDGDDILVISCGWVVSCDRQGGGSQRTNTVASYTYKVVTGQADEHHFLARLAPNGTVGSRIMSNVNTKKELTYNI